MSRLENLEGKGVPSLRRVPRGPERGRRIVDLSVGLGSHLPPEPNARALPRGSGVTCRACYVCASLAPPSVSFTAAPGGRASSSGNASAQSAGRNTVWHRSGSRLSMARNGIHRHHHGAGATSSGRSDARRRLSVSPARRYVTDTSG